MSTNPYARFLTGQDPVSIASETPQNLERLLQQIGESAIAQPYAPGKWTVAQVVCHLADVEIAWGMRLRQAATQAHHVIQPFEQDDWAKPYAQMEWKLALAAFLALRRWNLAFLATVDKKDYGRQVTHPERGTMTFEGLLQTMAGHDLNHLAQLEGVTAKAPA